MPNRKNGEKLGARRDFGQTPAQSGPAQREKEPQAPPMDCAACEAALADALDGRLDPATQKAFDQHAGICAGCDSMVADARRGLAWLEILKESRPEPPPTLLASILARTSGSRTSGSHAANPFPNNLAAGSPMTLPGAAFGTPLQTPASAFPLPARPAGPGVFAMQDGRQGISLWHGAKWNSLSMAAIAQTARQTILQPRLAMTAAMAFFSITLTMNLMGVRLADLKAADLKPSSIRRSFYEANAHVIRNLDNLRVVYEVEASVRDLRRASEPDDSSSGNEAVSSPADGAAGSGSQTAQPQPPAASQPNDDSAKPQPKKHAAPDGNGGTSRREPDGNRSGSRISVRDVRQPAPARPEIPSLLAMHQEGRAAIRTEEDAAIRIGQHSAMKTGLRTKIQSEIQIEQLVSQGLISKSGMPGRRMA
ncbi:MAG: anti-sigma factor [Acidobacteriaceae bacterium]